MCISGDDASCSLCDVGHVIFCIFNRDFAKVSEDAYELSYVSCIAKITNILIDIAKIVSAARVVQAEKAT